MVFLQTVVTFKLIILFYTFSSGCIAVYNLSMLFFQCTTGDQEDHERVSERPVALLTAWLDHNSIADDLNEALQSP